MAEQHDLLRARISRRSLLKGGALLSAGPLLLRATAADTAAPMGPRWIHFGADPQTAMTVSTAIPTSFRKAAVEYGTDASFGQVAQLDVNGVAGVTTRYGAARISGLTPDTKYSYRVRVDGQTGKTATFRTAPANPRPFTFTAFGDEGTGDAPTAVIAQLQARQSQLHLLAGDLCYADTSGQGLSSDVFHPKRWDRWLQMIEPVAATVPWMTVVGNHEMEPGLGPEGYDGYLARFALPSNGASGCPATYHFRYGSVAFIQVDSNDVCYEIPHNLGYSHGTQDSWLESALSEYRRPGSGVDFIVVTMHHCAYSTAKTHGSEGGIRDHWTRLFDRYGVDLVISGHNHSYERTHPLRAGQMSQRSPSGTSVNSAKGTTYLTVGGGGAPLSEHGFSTGTYLVSDVQTPKTHKLETISGTDWSAVSDRSYCFAVCDVTPGTADASPTLSITVYDDHGMQIDSVRLERTASVVPSQSGGGSDTGLYVGIGVGAAALAAAGGTGYALHRRRSEARWEE